MSKITAFALALMSLLAMHGGAAAGEKIPRIGILFIGNRNQPHLGSFKQGLRDLGYLEDKNIVLVYRYAEGKQDNWTLSPPNWCAIKSTSSSRPPPSARERLAGQPERYRS